MSEKNDLVFVPFFYTSENNTQFQDAHSQRWSKTQPCATTKFALRPPYEDYEGFLCYALPSRRWHSSGDPNPRGPGGPLVEAWRFGLAGRLLMSSQRPSNSTWPPRLLIDAHDAPDQPAWSAWPAWPAWGSEVEAQSCEKWCFGWGSTQLRPHLSGAQSDWECQATVATELPVKNQERIRKGICIKCLTCSYAALLCEPMVFSLIDVKAGDRARHLASHQQGFSLPFVERRFVRWRQ